MSKPLISTSSTVTPKTKRYKNDLIKGGMGCTAAEEVFINELIKGESQRKAYRTAYPHRALWKDHVIDTKASLLLKREQVLNRYTFLLKQHRDNEQQNTAWTRENSIKTLKFVVGKNQDEVNRIHDAVEEEIEILLKQIEEDPDNARVLTQELLKKRKQRRLSAIHNQGIIAAVSELNKMQGFNEENINVHSSVKFVGENDLED